MIIEFFGISGVGKTTICKEIYKNQLVEWPRYHLYEKHGWLVRNIIKLVSIIKFLPFNIKWVMELNKEITITKIPKLKDRLNLLFNGCSLKTLQLKCKKNKKYLFDEGLIQYLWAINLRSNQDTEIKNITNIINLFTLPKKVYVIVADSNIIYDRLISRKRRTKILEYGNVLNKINKMKLIQNRIIDKLVDNIGIDNIIYFDATERIENVKKLRI